MLASLRWSQLQLFRRLASGPMMSFVAYSLALLSERVFLLSLRDCAMNEMSETMSRSVLQRSQPSAAARMSELHTRQLLANLTT